MKKILAITAMIAMMAILMGATTIDVKITSPELSKTIDNDLNKADKSSAIKGLENYLKSLSGGRRNGKYVLDVDGADGTSGMMTYHFTGTAAGNDTMIIGKNKLKLVTTSGGEDEVTAASTQNDTATAFATAINAHSILSLFITATTDENDSSYLYVRQTRVGVGGNAIFTRILGTGMHFQGVEAGSMIYSATLGDNSTAALFSGGYESTSTVHHFGY